MTYDKTLWQNRLVERPKTFRMQQNADGTVTLIPEEGQIIKPGTPINADNMNKIEDTLANHDGQIIDITTQVNNIEVTADKTSFSNSNFTSDNVGGALGELFTFANNGKNGWCSVIGTPLLTTDSFSTLQSKTQVIKNSIAEHLTSKGQPSTGSEALQTLSDKIKLIESSPIKSIQRGYTHFTGSSRNIAINNVDMNSAVLFIEIEEVKWGSCGADQTTVAGEITSSTNIKLIGVNASDIHVAWTVVEFNNVKSIQKGIKTVSYSNRCGTISVSTYDTQKYLIAASFYSTDTGTYRATQAGGVYYNTKTSISYRCQPNNGQVSLYWQLIEFK